jgi:RNA polymerase sigma-70 factor (ECF subfamily)
MSENVPGEFRNSDHSLLQRFRDGEQDAATELFLKYGARLQALARSQTSASLGTRFDPEDVIQSVFRTFFRRAANGLYDVPEGDELWQLLLVIALNKIRSLATYHRAAKRDISRTEEHVESDKSQYERSNIDKNSLDTLEVVLDDFLDSLPVVQAEVARMRMQGFQVADIAEKTGRSKRTVERTLNSLRKSLLERLEID